MDTVDESMNLTEKAFESAAEDKVGCGRYTKREGEINTVVGKFAAVRDCPYNA
jgi:hypothetical protein